jgi:hypothetical protein
MGARDEVLDLLAEDRGLRDWFARLCASGPEALSAQSRQFASMIADGGTFAVPVSVEPRLAGDVEDALFDLAGELLPDSPAARPEHFERWAAELAANALAHLAEFRVEGQQLAAVGGDEVDRAAASGSRVAYRAALRRWTKATLEGIYRASEAA